MLRPSCSNVVASSNRDYSTQTDLVPPKVRRTSQSDIIVPTSRKPPAKPLIPYIRYSSKVWSQVKAQNPDVKFREIGRIIGQMWRELPELEKTVFVEAYKAEKLEYDKQLQLYRNFGAFAGSMAAHDYCPQKERDKQETYNYPGSGPSKQSTFMYNTIESVNVENEEIKFEGVIETGAKMIKNEGIKTDGEIIKIEDEVIKTEDEMIKSEDVTKTHDVITGLP
ncbi:hypothetical protein PR048_003623 [Dryococelus australis]|uniref:HMG box domain-containing protein n=1 Tax=Dryococelus australis TaxID=614101 RepID=A0ABQ9INJ0_9NEOP|nr:hypothetical protein PR048_003623 [Dryococelus australis]